MEVHMRTKHTAILRLLFLVIIWADVKADEHGYDAAATKKTIQDLIHCNNIESLCSFTSVAKGNISKLNDHVSNVTRNLEKVQDNVEILEQKVYNTRDLLDNTVSVQENENKINKIVTDFRKVVEDLKLELKKNRNSLEQKFEVTLEALNETLQSVVSLVPQDLRQQIDKLNEKQNQTVATDFISFEKSKAFQDVLQQISNLKENYVSKDELQRDKRAIGNKCSLNVRQKPEGGRFDVRMVLDPPSTEPCESD